MNRRQLRVLQSSSKISVGVVVRQGNPAERVEVVRGLLPRVEVSGDIISVEDHVCVGERREGGGGG